MFFFAAHLDLFVGCFFSIFSDSTVRFINKKNITSFWNGKIITLPETNIASENRPLQKEIHLPTIDFQVRLLLAYVSWVTFVQTFF